MPKSPKPTVYELSRASRCHNCDTKLVVGQIVKLENREDEREALCRKCAGLDGMEIVPVGNAALTKLATRYSDPHYVIMRWSDLWKSYERKGVLVTREALDKATSEL